MKVRNSPVLNGVLCVTPHRSPESDGESLGWGSRWVRPLMCSAARHLVPLIMRLTATVRFRGAARPVAQGRGGAWAQGRSLRRELVCQQRSPAGRPKRHSGSSGSPGLRGVGLRQEDARGDVELGRRRLADGARNVWPRAGRLCLGQHRLEFVRVGHALLPGAPGVRRFGGRTRAESSRCNGTGASRAPRTALPRWAGTRTALCTWARRSPRARTNTRRPWWRTCGAPRFTWNSSPGPLALAVAPASRDRRRQVNCSRVGRTHK